MNAPSSDGDAPALAAPPPPTFRLTWSGTPLAWRLAIGAGIAAVFAAAYAMRDSIGSRGQAVAGLVCFLGLLAACSTNLRRVNWRLVGTGFGLQLLLVLFVLKFEVFGVRPGYEFFAWVGKVVKQFLAFSNEGAQFVFGPLAKGDVLAGGFGKDHAFIFAFSALPTVIFIASVFSVLYHIGVLQLIVKLFARVMVYIMGTSGAETLSVTANVFMGQTEAPLIVKPYIPRMTPSELLTLMVGGMAHISGGVMAIYIGLGADPVAILATSVMAAPASLYLTKLVLPELGEPETRGRVKAADERPHANVIDAAAAGASDGMRLAINIAAMLIAFIAFIAMFNYLLGVIAPGLSLQRIFSWVFWPLAFLMGVQGDDVPRVAELLGTKLVLNEFVAYLDLTGKYRDVLDPRSFVLATYALTGFANFASIGIQLGGIGGMAPNRRGDIARLGGLALFIGFLATLINASIAAMLM
jgi:CNT family concentrative nucleoside transporter